MSDYTNLWNLASAPSQFSQLPEDELLALLQKQFQPISHGAVTPSDSNKDGNVDPVSITKLSLSGVTPSTDDSSPSPSANNVDSVSRRQSHSSYPRQGNNHAQGDETPALKRKASDDDLDEEHNPKNKLAVDESGTKKGQSSKRKSTGNSQDESRLLKRKEQNRAAQRAFRERKEKHVKDLEDQVAALEAKNEEAQTENNNLRDLLSRLQQENIALRQAQFTFSVPKSAPPSASVTQAPSTTPNSNMHPPSSSPFSFFGAPEPSSLGGDIDWGTLTTFDPGMLSMLDEPPVGDVTMEQQPPDYSSSPFGQYALPPPNQYRTIASSPWLMTFADTPETPSTTTAVTTSPVSMNGTNGGNAFDAFGFGRFGLLPSSNQAWPPSTGQTLTPANFNQHFAPSNNGLDELFSGGMFPNGAPQGNRSGQDSGGPMEFGTTFVDDSLLPPSISPVSHANGNAGSARIGGANANVGPQPNVPSSSTSPASSPDIQRSNSSPSLRNNTASSSPLTSVSGSRHGTDGGNVTAGESNSGLKKRITREDVAKHIAACGESPFTSPSVGCSTIGLTPESESRGEESRVLRKASDVTQGDIISCQGSRFPRTEESPDNVEVLQAWRSITSSPCFKDADVNQLCTEFSKKARCDGTKVVLEPEGVRHIIEKFKMNGPHCMPNPQPHAQQEQQHLQHIQLQLQGQL
ncbi:hypothetical protein F5J12DRAFT_467957 [Pisolithus orientalis]|nr:uncharacterized protein F5J12DRAFT_467957 [Pisolithus orientalis]KAI5991295.1 hypothetical protein F5J12DRAFT_467957 [Pisolithus orientalis]